jgi:hypothetical protein
VGAAGFPHRHQPHWPRRVMASKADQLWAPYLFQPVSSVFSGCSCWCLFRQGVAPIAGHLVHHLRIPLSDWALCQTIPLSDYRLVNPILSPRSNWHFQQYRKLIIEKFNCANFKIVLVLVFPVLHSKLGRDSSHLNRRGIYGTCIILNIGFPINPISAKFTSNLWQSDIRYQSLAGLEWSDIRMKSSISDIEYRRHKVQYLCPPLE